MRLYAASEDDPERAKLFSELHEGLKQAEWSDLIGRKLRYTEMGKYAEPIGRTDETAIPTTG